MWYAGRAEVVAADRYVRRRYGSQLRHRIAVRSRRQ